MRDVRKLINFCTKHDDIFGTCMNCPLVDECSERFEGENLIDIYQRLMELDRLRERIYRKRLKQ